MIPSPSTGPKARHDLERCAGDRPSPIHASGFQSSADSRGFNLGLTPVEFRLLERLARRPGQVLSRSQLLDALHVDERASSDRTIDSHIKNLRRKMRAVTPEHDPVESVYGVGYKLVMS